jgi:large subunit ribosomal protein L21
MIAIVEIAGKQYKVAPKSLVQVDLLEGEAGDSVTLDKVLLTSDEDGNNCKIGTPYTGDSFKAKIVENVKGDKVRIVKFRPKARYARTKGHRQNYSIIEVAEF